jgi:hypothetical protein
MKKVVLTVCLSLLLFAGAANADLMVDATNYTYTQNFNTLAFSGNNNAWTNDSTLEGWSLFNKSPSDPAITTYNAGTGSDNTGNFYSFGATSSSERALGGVGSGGSYFKSPASGAVAGWIAVAFTNNTGSILNGFSVGFDGEQWRDGGNTTPQSMVLEYGYGNTFADVSVWTAPGGSFDWTSPVATDTAGAIDGNSEGLVTGLGGSIATDWNADETLWIRWIENNDAGNDHGLAIDNFDFNVSPVPVPAAVWLLGSALLTVVGVRRRNN